MNFQRTMIAVGTMSLLACSQVQEEPLSEPDPITEAEAQALLAPEPGASASEYQAQHVTLRLFGTNQPDEPAEASATLADTATWQTHTWRVGEAIARNLEVAAVSREGVRLRTPEGSFFVRIGQDVRVRQVKHADDLAALEQGEHVWRVKPRQLARLLQRKGLGATAQLDHWEGQPMLRLSAVRKGSLLDRLGFQEGDLLHAVEDEPVSAGTLEQLAARLTTEGPQVTRVRMSRGHSGWEVSYVSQ